MADITVSNSKEEHPVLDDASTVAGKEKIAFTEQQDHRNELEGKKKRLLEELESSLVLPNPIIPKPNCLGFGIEVIDETALLDSIPKMIGKQSRRRATTKNKKNIVTETEKKKKNQKKKKYSREEMESLRFGYIQQQRNFWKTIYEALQSNFADEYDTLVAAPNKPILTGVGAANGRCGYMNVFVH